MKFIPFEVLLLSVTATGALGSPTAHPKSGSWSQQASLGSNRANVNSKDSNSRIGQGYICFQSAAQYPSTDEWLSFDHLWKINRQSILSSNGGDTYIEHYLMDSILRVASESRIDARLIFVLMMQQSHGRASIGCKVHKARCGLLQTTFGTRGFEDAHPEASILQMFREGIQGLNSVDTHGSSNLSLAYFLGDEACAKSSAKSNDPYASIATYELELMNASDDLENKNARVTRFINDIANRLIGWYGRGAVSC